MIRVAYSVIIITLMKYLYNSYLYQKRDFLKLLFVKSHFHVTHISIDFAYVSPDILLSGPRRYSSQAGLLRPHGGGNTAGAPPFPLDGRRAGNDPSTALSMAGGSAANPGEGRVARKRIVVRRTTPAGALTRRPPKVFIFGRRQRLFPVQQTAIPRVCF